MCIINEPAEVTQTQIFVAPSADRKSQITVYCNKVMTNSTNNVMVLPVPFPDTLKFIDLSDYKNMFTDLEMNFKRWEQRSLSYSANSCEDRSYLPTIDVGSYRITVSPNIPQLSKVDPNQFGRIQDHIKNILNKHYFGYGFIICKLIPGKETEYHPLAYSHKLLNDMLFVPTRHQHNHTSAHSSSYHHTIGEEHESDWDHDIYSFNTAMSANNSQLTDQKIHLKLDKFGGFNFGGIKSLNKYKIKGYYPNQDVYFEMVR